MKRHVALIMLALATALCFTACRNNSKNNAALVGNWSLTTLPDTSFTIPQGRIYITFDGKGAVSGNGGCNDFSGNYTAKGNSLHLSNLINTLMWCDYGDLETKFLTALKLTNNYAVSNKTLSLYQDAKLLATLTMY
ncbi:MAG: META domain-containing protein [Bacteroidetes bacterium]|nr:META domain-containing protein [Bacteroidota bacterium]